MFAILLAIFSLMYLAMQSYMVMRVRRAVPQWGYWPWLLMAWGLLAFVLMAMSMGLRDRPWLARLGPAINVAFAWLAILFWFFVAGLIGDLWNGVFKFGGIWLDQAKRLVISPPALTWSVMAIVALCLIWSIIEGRYVRVVRQEFGPVVPAGQRAAKVSAVGSNPVVAAVDMAATEPAPAQRHMRIVQLSDLHLTGYTGRGHFADLVRRIEELKPDMIVATGDMMDAPASELTDLAAMLAALKPPLGKLAVMGNHEYYTGLREAVRFHQDAGFRLLRQQWVDAGGLHVAGVDDPTFMPSASLARRKEVEVLDAARGRTVLLLKHQPRVEADSVGKFRLQLSGHTHGGQFYPFYFLSRMVYPNIRGRYSLPGGSELYVNKGAGTWGPPLRLLAPPEITLIELSF